MGVSDILFIYFIILLIILQVDVWPKSVVLYDYHQPFDAVINYIYQMKQVNSRNVTMTAR